MTTENQSVNLTIPTQQIHKAVRNCLINEYGASKEVINNIVRTYVEQKVEEILREHILQANWFNSFIERTITSLIKEGVQSGEWRYDKKEPFTKFVKKEVRDAIQQHVIDNFDIKITEKNDD